MKMTNTIALENAISVLSTIEQTETITKTVERLTAMHDTLVNRAKATASNEKIQAAREKRKAETKAAREALMTAVLPVLRSVITTEPKTAEQIYIDAKSMLPTDWSKSKVQYALLHELAGEVKKVENGRNAMTYKKA